MNRKKEKYEIVFSDDKIHRENVLKQIWWQGFHIFVSDQNIGWNGTGNVQFGSNDVAFSKNKKPVQTIFTQDDYGYLWSEFDSREPHSYIKYKNHSIEFCLIDFGRDSYEHYDSDQKYLENYFRIYDKRKLKTVGSKFGLKDKIDDSHLTFTLRLTPEAMRLLVKINEKEYEKLLIQYQNDAVMQIDLADMRRLIEKHNYAALPDYTPDPIVQLYRMYHNDYLAGLDLITPHVAQWQLEQRVSKNLGSYFCKKYSTQLKPLQDVDKFYKVEPSTLKTKEDSYKAGEVNGMIKMLILLEQGLLCKEEPKKKIKTK